MFYKIIIILLAIYSMARLYEYYYNRKSISKNKNKLNKINSIKKNNIKDAEFEEIQ